MYSLFFVFLIIVVIFWLRGLLELWHVISAARGFSIKIITVVVCTTIDGENLSEQMQAEIVFTDN